jgi:hypothetical protein
MGIEEQFSGEDSQDTEQTDLLNPELKKRYREFFDHEINIKEHKLIYEFVMRVCDADSSIASLDVIDSDIAYQVSMSLNAENRDYLAAICFMRSFYSLVFEKELEPHKTADIFSSALCHLRKCDDYFGVMEEKEIEDRLKGYVSIMQDSYGGKNKIWQEEVEYEVPFERDNDDFEENPEDKEETKESAKKRERVSSLLEVVREDIQAGDTESALQHLKSLENKVNKLLDNNIP